MKKVMKRIWTVALLAMVSTVTMAQDDNPAVSGVKVEFGEGFTVSEDGKTGTLTGGTIFVNSQTNATDVTITVTPAKDFFITKNDIKVYLTVPASTRSVDFENLLTLSGEEPKDKMAARDYTFTVPAGFGAIIYEADFQSADALYNIGDDSKSGSVRWSLNEEKTVMTIAGTGRTKDFRLGESDFVDPFEAFRAEGSTVKSIVIEAGVTALGANIFKNFVGLEKISIKENSALLTLGKEAINSNTVPVEVSGNLYNEYQITDGWKDLKIAFAEGSVAMADIAFDASNSYRAFVYSGQSLMIPSVLKAWVISGLNASGTSLELSEVKDIPANVPVLLTASNKVSDGFYTSPIASAASSAGKYLKVAPEGGLTVGAGQVYLLYNDRFYFSQAGTLSANRVYLDMRPEPAAKTRSSLGIGDDGTTAIRRIDNGQLTIGNGIWYTLDGRKLQTAPSRKGVYINDGKKVVVK
jgi:hypothetical protein